MSGQQTALPVLENREGIKRLGSLVVNGHISQALHAGEIQALSGKNCAGDRTKVQFDTGFR
jgi:ABC-type uncharacterized transport system ATPase subunit